MGSASVLLYFDGKWNDSNKYTDFSIRGIFVPLDCSYDRLVKMVSQQLGVDSSHSKLILQYQVFDASPAIPISDDSSLQFYLDLKKEETDKRKLPICVDFDILNPGLINVAPSQNFEIDEIDEHSLMFAGTSRHNPTMEEMGMELAGFVNLEPIAMDEDLFNVITKVSVEDIEQGSVYMNKDLVVTSVSLFAIRNQFQFSVVKSDTKFYWLKCHVDGCKWKFKASRTGTYGHFKIRDLSNEHTCSMDTVLCDHKQATSFVIANCVKHNFLSARRIYTAVDIKEDMQHYYGVVVSYDKAWRAREIAIKMIRGDPDISYGKLPLYMERLKDANPGTSAIIETDSEGRFLFSFVALGASIAGWKHCKPVIVVDGTFLTGRYGGTLFTASTQDANNNIYILAFGVGDSENNNAWLWFMSKLKEAYGDRDELCIVSDRHGSIAHAVDTVFPNALHGACTYHLLTNLKRELGKKGKGMRVHFNAASRAYTVAEFETHMETLDAIDVGIRGYLILDAIEKIGLERWTRAYMSKDRYSTMTSNIAESVNSAIKHAKSFPVVALFECLRCTIQKWFAQNLSDANSTFTQLAKRHDAMLKERIKKSKRLRVHPCSDTLFQVNEDTLTYVVDISERSCSCRRFQLDHIPCPHAIAVIASRSYSLSEYCSKYFTKEEYITTYQQSIYPVGNKEDSNVRNEGSRMIVLAPMAKRGPGRPKENRLKSCLEKGKRTRCTKCDSYGHNTRTCRNPVPSRDLNKRKRPRFRDNPRRS